MTESVVVALVVEGHGDVQAVPLLLRRVALEIDPALPLETPKPVRLKKGMLKRPGELERAVSLAAGQVLARGGVLVLFDADADCPAEVGPELLARCTAAHGHVPISVVLAKSEFEAWFIAAAPSIAGRRDLPDDLIAPNDPESVAGAKEWLASRMPFGRTYSPTIDQPALAATFDLGMARERSPSFQKFSLEVGRLLHARRLGA